MRPVSRDISIMTEIYFMSAFGTKRTWRDVRVESAFGGKADMPRETGEAPGAFLLSTWQIEDSQIKTFS